MEDAHGKVAGVVLAAGKSQRMGEFKPVMKIGDKPMLQRVIESAMEGGIEPVFVVSGFQAEQVREIIQQCGAREVHNAEFEKGMLSSVQAAARAVGEVRAFVMMLGDQPGVKPQTYRTIVEAWERSGADVVVPSFEGKKGHPVLFDGKCVPEILALTEGQTLKDVVEKHARRRIEVPVTDSAVLADVDTKEDYEREVRRHS